MSGRIKYDDEIKAISKSQKNFGKNNQRIGNETNSLKSQHKSQNVFLKFTNGKKMFCKSISLTRNDALNEME